MPGIEIAVDKLIKMQEYIEQLKKIKPDSYSEYKNNLVTKYAIERIIQLIIDLAIDINNILLAYLKKPPAADYFNSFIQLAECHLLDQSFALKIAPSTGMRNRLVHEYEKINDEIIYNNLNNVIEMYSKYVIEINKFVQK
jgi:uncharacterized protein YutE (UPF0331/DUF86 family)